LPRVANIQLATDSDLCNRCAVLPDGKFLYGLILKNPSLGKVWRVLQWNMMVYFMVIWSILRPFGYIFGSFGIVYDNFCVYFFRFGMFYQEKSGNPAVVYWTSQS
jgi:hypothetical protein